MQYITRKGYFDAGHRIMNEKVKCHHLHGHTFIYELTFGFELIENIGYQIDFKEIKRIAIQWIEDYLDHGMLINPQDEILIQALEALKTKYWPMNLNGAGQYCNPTVENIAKVIFLAIELLFSDWDNLKISTLRLYETPNCYTDCFKESISSFERENFHTLHAENILAYARDKGRIEYDDRK